jgi:Na+-driven multidrug efflux pump
LGIPRGYYIFIFFNKKNENKNKNENENENLYIFIYIINIFIYISFFKIGFGNANSILSNREYKKGNIKNAKNYFKIISFFSIFINIIISFFIYFLRKILFEEILQEENLLNQSNEIFKALSFILIFDLIQFLFISFFIGIGKIIYAFVISFFCFFIFHIGLSFIFSNFFLYEIIGILLGILIGSIIANMIYLVVFLSINFKIGLFEDKEMKN